MFSYPLQCIRHPVLLEGLRTHWNIVIVIDVWFMWLPDRRCKTFEDMFSHFDTIPACDRQTDGQTSCDSVVRAKHRSVKIVVAIGMKLSRKTGSCMPGVEWLPMT